MSGVSADREAAIRARIRPFGGSVSFADVEWLLAKLAGAREREQALREALIGCWLELGWDEYEELTGPRDTASRWRRAREALAAAEEQAT